MKKNDILVNYQNSFRGRSPKRNTSFDRNRKNSSDYYRNRSQSNDRRSSFGNRERKFSKERRSSNDRAKEEGGLKNTVVKVLDVVQKLNKKVEELTKTQQIMIESSKKESKSFFVNSLEENIANILLKNLEF